jgi:hypothetical protein
VIIISNKLTQGFQLNYKIDHKVLPTTCVKGIKGKQEDRDGKPCKIYSGGRVDTNCNFIPDKSGNDALASIMFMPHIDSVSNST